MKEVYLIHLVGQGDVSVKLVSKETFDWIEREWPGSFEEHYLEDRTCPSRQLELMRKEWKSSGDEMEYPGITIGSFNNDRAIHALPEFGSEFYTLVDALDFVRENDMRIAEIFEGYIY